MRYYNITCMCTHVCIYIYIYSHTHIYVYTCVCIYVYIYTYIYIYVHTYIEPPRTSKGITESLPQTSLRWTRKSPSVGAAQARTPPPVSTFDKC